MKRVITVVGARPQFIKAGTVARAIIGHNRFCSCNRAISHRIVHTGQHYDTKLSQIFFDELGIAPPEYNLGVGSDSHGVQTGKLLASLEGVLELERPDLVLIYGDTNSTLAGALAASKLHIPLAHVEAGLRSFNRYMPEEINRIITDEISNLLFCPTTTAVSNLKNEGIPSERSAKQGSRDINFQAVYQVGDVMFDSILYYKDLAVRKSRILDDFGLNTGKYCLATLHRAENTDDPSRLVGILKALASIADSGMQIILPLHPRTQKAISEHPDWPEPVMGTTNGVRYFKPVGYLDMVQLEANATAILTDSGGVQKEAYFLGVPCITLRDETEWIETVSEGWNMLVGASSERITAAYKSISAWNRNGPPFPNGDIRTASASNIYGDGHAADKIATVISEYLA
jgi:UDP-GlcNAc3NAcA epimerase